MKTLFWTIAVITSFGLFNLVHASEEIKSTEYKGVCRYEHPLSTYDSCTKFSEAGEIAAACASNEALVQCRGDRNVDCVKVGTRYVVVFSRDFLGYRACEATVLVRGYK